MKNSGAFEVSKYEYLSKLPKDWIPKTKLTNKFSSALQLEKIVAELPFSFPLIAKPDMGERGKQVSLVKSLEELKQYFQSSKFEHILLQEYVPYQKETGILFFSYPDGSKDEISSITEKGFCTIIGNGIDTIGTLISTKERIQHRRKEFKEKYAKQWDTTLEKGEQLIVEPIGSHNRGTTFYDARKNNSPELLKQIKKLANQLPGFYYGRFDIKFTSWKELEKGENFKIIEVNGVNSEPTHIYQPYYSIIEAYKDIFYHMKIIYTISNQNYLLGKEPESFSSFIKGLGRVATLKTKNG